MPARLCPHERRARERLGRGKARSRWGPCGHYTLCELPGCLLMVHCSCRTSHLPIRLAAAHSGKKYQADHQKCFQRRKQKRIPTQFDRSSSTGPHMMTHDLFAFALPTSSEKADEGAPASVTPDTGRLWLAKCTPELDRRTCNDCTMSSSAARCLERRQAWSRHVHRNWPFGTLGKREFLAEVEIPQEQPLGATVEGPGLADIASEAAENVDCGI